MQAETIREIENDIHTYVSECKDGIGIRSFPLDVLANRIEAAMEAEHSRLCGKAHDRLMAVVRDIRAYVADCEAGICYRHMTARHIGERIAEAIGIAE